MTTTTRRALAGGTAVLLALAALFPVFKGADWLWPCVGSISVVVSAGLLARRTRLPGALVLVLQVLVLGLYLAVLYAHATFRDALPTQATADALRLLVEQGNTAITMYAPPVPPERGIVLITAAGVGLVAVMVDLVAVTLDRAALAGLPLLALFAVPSAVLPGGLGTWPFLIGAVGWMVLLLEEGTDRIGRWGTPLRATSRVERFSQDNSLSRLGRRIGATALGCALVVPAAIPGLDQRLISGRGTGFGSGDGGDGGPSTATTFNPITRLHDQLTRPKPQQLLVYTTDDSDPDYLRMTTLDRWTGDGWMASELQADRDDARVQRGIPRPRGESSAVPHRTLAFRAAVDGANLDVHWLPVPYGPTKVEVDGTWLWDEESQTVFSASRTTKRLAPYAVTASRVLPDRQALRAAGTTVDGPIARAYGRSIEVSKRVQQLTARLTRGLDNHYDRAVAIQRYFTSARNGFVYDLEASRPAPGQSALDGFLDGKRGFCEQYASAMAALLRVAGVPSRVAVGFTPGELVEGREDTYRITTAQAHAWPEAWFEGSGWVRFEPTPGADGATTPDYTLTPTRPDAQPTASPTPEPTPSAAAAGPRFRDPNDLLGEETGGATPDAATSSPWRWLTPVLVLAALAAALPSLLTLVRRRRRAATADPLHAWDQLRDDVTDVGLPWREAESPRSTADRLLPELPTGHPGRPALERLASTVELARFAPPGRAPRTDLAGDGTAVRHGLRAAAPRVVRLRAVVAPPSTLRWLSHVLSERVADALDALDRLISLLGRPFARVLRPRA